MRESLFEQLKKKQIFYIDELKKLWALITEYSETYRYFYNSFKNSSYCAFYRDFENAMCEIFENENQYDFGIADTFGRLIQANIAGGFNMTLNSWLNYLEFLLTLLLDYKDSFDINNVNQIIKIIEIDSKKTGYKLVFDKEQNVFVAQLINLKAEAVALEVTENTRETIYRYLQIRTGNVKSKRECIKTIADEVEVMCQKYANVKEYSKLKQFIQCVRHTKDKPKKEFPFYYIDEEKWLDKIFEMSLGVLAFEKTKDITKEIVDLENKKLVAQK